MPSLFQIERLTSWIQLLNYSFIDFYKCFTKSYGVYFDLCVILLAKDSPAEKPQHRTVHGHVRPRLHGKCHFAVQVNRPSSVNCLLFPNIRHKINFDDILCWFLVLQLSFLHSVTITQWLESPPLFELIVRLWLYIETYLRYWSVLILHVKCSWRQLPVFYVSIDNLRLAIKVRVISLICISMGSTHWTEKRPWNHRINLLKVNHLIRFAHSRIGLTDRFLPNI